MSSVDQFAAKMEKTARAIEGATRDGVNEAAAIVGVAVDAAIASVVGADRQFSGIDTNGKIGALVKKARALRNSTAFVVAAPEGLASIINSGAKPHIVGGLSKSGRRIRDGVGLEETARGTRVVRILGSGKWTRSVSHGGAFMSNGKGGSFHARGPFMAGGFKGTHKIDEAYTLMAPRVSALVQREVGKAVGRSFR